MTIPLCLKRKETIASCVLEGNTDRNLNTADIPASGGYRVMSLHGVPLLRRKHSTLKKDEP